MLGVSTPSFELTGGRLCLDFANTVDDRPTDHPKDRLKGYEALVAFGLQAGILSNAEVRELASASRRYPRKGARIFREAMALRETIFRIFAAVVIPTVWKQLVHILEVEETWVLDLQDQSWTHWREEDCADLRALLANKARVQSATQDYLHGLSDMELNRRLTERPQQWVGELRSPAFIILHIVTHAFHHKGQVVAMLRTLGYPAPDTDLQRA